MDGAGAAERHAAAEFRAGHTQHVAEHPQERRVAVDVDRAIGSIDLDGEGHERYSDVMRVDRSCAQ
jgi:hypothetical protein